MNDESAPRHVVDTNVPLVANEQHSEASPDCVIACSRALLEVRDAGHVVVDDGWRIIGEYKHKLSPTGQPGPGDAFLKWLLSNLGNPDRCTQVALTPREDDQGDFDEFPDALRAVGFDPSDRKFVATAVADQRSPEILQAADSKWWGWHSALKKAGVRVRFLCEAEIAAKHAGKQKDEKQKQQKRRRR